MCAEESARETWRVGDTDGRLKITLDTNAAERHKIVNHTVVSAEIFIFFLTVHFTKNITGKNHRFFPALLLRISCTLTASLGHVVAHSKVVIQNR